MEKPEPPKFFKNLKRYAEEHPEYALGLAVGAVGALGTLMKAYSEASYARVHKQEVKRRVAIQKAKGVM